MPYSLFSRFTSKDGEILVKLYKLELPLIEAKMQWQKYLGNPDYLLRASQSSLLIPTCVVEPLKDYKSVVEALQGWDRDDEYWMPDAELRTRRSRIRSVIGKPGFVIAWKPFKMYLVH